MLFCTHVHADMPEWIQNEETEESTHKTAKTWIKVDSIHVKVDEPKNGVIKTEEAELLKKQDRNIGEVVGWGTLL